MENNTLFRYGTRVVTLGSRTKLRLTGSGHVVITTLLGYPVILWSKFFQKLRNFLKWALWIRSRVWSRFYHPVPEMTHFFVCLTFSRFHESRKTKSLKWSGEYWWFRGKTLKSLPGTNGLICWVPLLRLLELQSHSI